jgi:hypothetical protein
MKMFYRKKIIYMNKEKFKLLTEGYIHQFKVPEKRKKDMNSLYDMIKGKIDYDDIDHEDEDDIDQTYLKIIDDAYDSGLSLKISKLYHLNKKNEAYETAYNFIKSSGQKLTNKKMDEYAKQMVIDYKDQAFDGC